MKVALVTPHLSLGGPRGWMLDLLTRVRVDWLGVVCPSDELVDGWVLDEFRRVTTVHGFCRESMREVMDADVLIAWGCQRMDDLVPADYAGRVVFVSKGADTGFTRPAIQGGLRSVADWIASSEVSLTPFDGLVPRGQVTIIHNGIDTERCRPGLGRETTRLRLGFRDGQIVCAFVGRFSWEKRPALLAHALELLPANYAGLWVGGGHQYDQFAAEIRDAIPGWCTLVPPTDRVGDVLAAADVVVAPSMVEGFCFGFVEALWAGRPLVATPTGILPEIERSLGRRCWQQVPTNATAEQVAEAIVEAAAHPERAGDAKELIEAEYTVDVMARNWEAYLNGLPQGR